MAIDDRLVIHYLREKQTRLRNQADQLEPAIKILEELAAVDLIPEPTIIEEYVKDVIRSQPKNGSIFRDDVRKLLRSKESTIPQAVNTLKPTYPNFSEEILRKKITDALYNMKKMGQVKSKKSKSHGRNQIFYLNENNSKEFTDLGVNNKV